MSEEHSRQSESGRSRAADRKSLKALVHEYVALARRAAHQQSDRKLIWFHDDDGSLVIEGRLPVEEGLMLIKALEAACEAIPKAEGVSAETPNVK